MAILDGLQVFAQWVFVNSLKASILIALIFMIQWFVRDRLPAKWQHALWLILIVRLLLPAGFESNLSLYNLLNKSDRTREISARILTQPMRAVTEAPSSDPALVQTPIRQYTLVDLLASLWMAGVLSFTLVTLIGNLRCWMKIRKRQPVTEPRLLSHFSECRKRMAVRRSIQLAQLDTIQIPMLYGWLRPVILLPASQIQKWTPDQINHILCHELAHHKRNDILIAHITTFLQILHWFNPLMWLAFYKIRLDREIACDAIALNHLGREQSKSYGSTILSLLENISTESLLPMTVGIVESKKNLKRRLISIARFKKPRLIWTVIGLILATGIGLGVLTEAKKRNMDSDGVDGKSIEGELVNQTLNQSESTNDLSFRDLIEQIRNENETSQLIKFESNGKFGFYDRDGNIVVKPRFAGIGLFSESLAVVSVSTGFINTFANVFGKKFEYMRVLSKEKCGYIDQKGNIVIPLQYDVAMEFHEGLAPVLKDHKFGFIDRSGKCVIDFVYDGANIFFNGLAAVMKNGFWGFIDRQGRQVIPCMYEMAEIFSEGLAKVNQGGKWGFINEHNEFVIPPQFERALPFHNGLTSVKVNDQKYGIIDKTGKLVYQDTKFFAVYPPELRGSNGTVR